MRYKFSEMKHGWIVGIIDNYGHVKSKFLPDTLLSHADIFPHNIFKSWRWSFADSIVPSTIATKFDVEDWDMVERHIEKKYGIKFWENGYHDIDYFIQCIDAENRDDKS